MEIAPKYIWINLFTPTKYYYTDGVKGERDIKYIRANLFDELQQFCEIQRDQVLALEAKFRK